MDTTQTTEPHRTEYRKLPAVDSLAHVPELALLAAEYGLEALTAAIRAELAAARDAIAAGQAAPAWVQWPLLVQTRLMAANAPSLRPVINATGIIIHTNLGRAPLSDAAIAAVRAVAAGYSTLEYDLATGERGRRHDHARRLLCELTGAEGRRFVVNNNAAAVYLVLATLCQDQEVLISRGQLVEIGGGFRIPDVLRQSGARLVEVGTTNRTHPRDFAQAITADSAAIMRVHSSNFRQIGFVAVPALAELAAIAQAHNVLLIDDLGSGTLIDTTLFGLAYEPMVQESIRAGADLVTLSGDKLLGGPQAGIILGRSAVIERLRRHPMARALRVDKMTLSALEATLHAYHRGRGVDDIPVWRMIAAAPATLKQRATNWQEWLADRQIGAVLWPGESAVGGGSLPGETLPTWLLAVPVKQADGVAARLRVTPLPVVCRIQKDHLLFDPRTVSPAHDAALLEAVLHAVAGD